MRPWVKRRKLYQQNSSQSIFDTFSIFDLCSIIRLRLERRITNERYQSRITDRRCWAGAVGRVVHRIQPHPQFYHQANLADHLFGGRLRVLPSSSRLARFTQGSGLTIHPRYHSLCAGRDLPVQHLSKGYLENVGVRLDPHPGSGWPGHDAGRQGG